MLSMALTSCGDRRVLFTEFVGENINAAVAEKSADLIRGHTRVSAIALQKLTRRTVGSVIGLSDESTAHVGQLTCSAIQPSSQVCPQLYGCIRKTLKHL
jgi:hypothetical protein